MTREGKVTELPGIGKTLEEKLRALLETGDIPALVKLRAKFPAGLIDITRLPGFGPKRARRLYDELGIDSLDALRAAAEAGTIARLRGFGAKVEEQCSQTLADRGAAAGRAPRGAARKALGDRARRSSTALRAHPASDRVELAGSARRLADSVKDLDIIATATDPTALPRAFAELDVVESRPYAGRDAGARATHAHRHEGRPAVVEPDQFGNLLQHFTGSKAHNVALREAAVRRGLHVSEYGILDDATGETHRCATEEEVYELLGLPWIPPELREDRGELEAARDGRGCRSSIELERPEGRPAHAHDRLRRPQTRRGDGARGARARPASTSRSPTTRPRTASATTSRPTQLRRADRARSARSTSASRASRC